MINIAEVRWQFPYLEETLYLNTAACGLSWSGQGKAAAAFYDQMMARGYDGRDDWRSLAAEVQQQLASLMVVEPEEISFVGSTTEGLNLVTAALSVSAGDRVVLAQDEFPSMQAAVRTLERKGAKVCLIPIPDEERRTETLCDAARGARFVGTSHVQWHTGTKVDIKRLGEVCRTEGAILVVDGVQALGATPVNASGCDVYAASVFKWLLSGFGLGILVVRGTIRNELTPCLRGYFNPPPSNELRYGHLNYPGLCALKATLALLENIGWKAIFDRTAMLRQRLVAPLADAGVEIVTPPGAAAGILAVRAPDPSKLVNELNQQGVRIEAREGFIRISPHFYNTEDEIDRFCDLFLRLNSRVQL
jgi:selenocysteine lyase/cysteine desulfurase